MHCIGQLQTTIEAGKLSTSLVPDVRKASHGRAPSPGFCSQRGLARLVDPGGVDPRSRRARERAEMDDEGTKKKGRRRLRALFRAARSSLSLALNPPSSLSLSSLSLPQTGKRCFVGNLAWRTSWQDLKDKFREVGTVVYANVMRDDSGKL